VLREGTSHGMTVLGFHSSHEQIGPAALLRVVQAAEQAGFQAAMSSDHFSPWGTQQGHSGFAWSWLGAALQATTLPFGVVTAPGQRYHPAIIAQAVATLAEMFPSRFWVALGTGEAANEHITGDPWPDKPTRNARLRECVDVIRALLAGETVTHHGLIRVKEARLWSLPTTPPSIIGAAVSAETAHWVGEWADGLITINQPIEQLRRVLDAFREGGGDGKRTSLQVHLSYASQEEEALQIAHDQWRTNVFGSSICWDLERVEQFDEIGRYVRPEDVCGPVLVSSDLSRHIASIEEFVSLGFDEIYLHHVGQEQREFIEVFGEQVLPTLRSRPSDDTPAWT
jgi:probable non-F420 flavinoid oxidoreductase